MECATDSDAELTGTSATDGSLDDTPLPTLLLTLAEQKATAVVHLDGQGEIWLDQGRLYLATTPSSAELAKVLFDGRLGSSQDEIRAALRGRDASGRAALDLLADQLPDAEERIRRLLHEYNLTALFEMLVPQSGRYRVEPDVTHALGTRYAEETSPLLDKARERTDIWRRIAARIPSTSAIFTLSTALPSSVEERTVTSDEWRFLSRLNGRNTVADVINQTGESAFRVCSALYRLLLERVIEEAQSRPATTTTAADR